MCTGSRGARVAAQGLRARDEVVGRSGRGLRGAEGVLAGRCSTVLLPLASELMPYPGRRSPRQFLLSARFVKGELHS